ncbi:MAG: cohesin domain-containing protein, partial [Chloroflexaceae bacterium]
MQNPVTVRYIRIPIIYQKYWKLLWSLSITGLCAAWMLLSTGHITIKAADTTQAVVSLPTVTGKPGEQIDTALHIQPNSSQVLSMDITLTYDPAVISVVSIDQAAGLSAWSIFSNNLPPGTIRLSGAGSESLSGASDVVDITFTVVGSAGMDTDLTLTTVNLNEPALPVTIQHGQVSITADTPTPDTPTPDTPTPDTPTPDTPTPDTP